jgi:hypothetical protein
MIKNFFIYLQWIFSVFLVLFLITPSYTKDLFIDPEELPKNLYVAIHYSTSNFLKLPSEERKYLEGLLKQNIRIQFTSKGFNINKVKVVRTINIDRLLNRFSPSEGEGILLIDIKKINLFYGVIAGNYVIEGEAKLIKSDGNFLGPWKAIATRKEITIPLSVLDIARVLFKAIEHNNDAILAALTQRFVQKLAMQIPDLPNSLKSIKIYYVTWFVGDEQNAKEKSSLKRGDVIIVMLKAQPGLEGKLILSPLGIERPLQHSSDASSEYWVKYIVPKGINAEDVEIKLVVTNNYGDKLTLYYPRYINIDSTPPYPPTNLKAAIIGENIQLTWEAIFSPDFDHFLVFRKTVDEKNFKVIGTTRDSSFLDRNIKPGNVYIYKVAAVDHIGNISEDNKNPTVEVAVPLNEIKVIKNTIIKGVLPPATYVIGENVQVASGDSLIARYSRFIFQKPLIVKGHFIADHVNFIGNPNTINLGDVVYPLSDCIIVEGGQVDLRDVKFIQCKTALFVKSGKATVKEAIFKDNLLNILSYEPKEVVLEDIDFGTPFPKDFKLAGKVNLISFFADGKLIKVDKKRLLYWLKSANLCYLSLINPNQFHFCNNISQLESYAAILNNRKYSYVDQGLYNLCTSTENTECLLHILPVFIKKYPQNTQYVEDYLKFLYKKEGENAACRFAQEYLLLHPDAQDVKDFMKVFLQCSTN